MRSLLGYIKMFILALFLLINNVSGYKLLPMWWNIGQPHQFSKTDPNKIIFNSVPLCIYYANNKWNIIEDCCPHRGASLSKGKIVKSAETQCIQCPYHGWEFDEGKLIKIPGFNTLMIDNMADKNSLHLKKFSIKTINGNLYVGVTDDTKDYIYIPPEEFEFDKITESIIIKRPYQMVTENILDMSHISYIHSFGNLIDPDPYNIVYKKLSEYSGRTTFYYKAGVKSLSRILGNADTVIVENEFHLPSTTVTRVKANKIVKTIVTSSYPITKDTTSLTYKLYRNYLQNNMLADMFHFWQMRLTLKEDIDMLANVYEDNFLGKINTKYDITQKKYRDACDDLFKGKIRKRRDISNIVKTNNNVKEDYILFDKSIFPRVIKNEKEMNNKNLEDYKAYSNFLKRDIFNNNINSFATAINKALNLVNSVNNVQTFSSRFDTSQSNLFADIDYIAEKIKNKSLIDSNRTNTKNILSYNIDNKYPTNSFNDYRAYGNFINAYSTKNKPLNYVSELEAYGDYISKPKEIPYNDYKSFGNFLGTSKPNKESYNSFNDIPSSYN